MLFPDDGRLSTQSSQFATLARPKMTGPLNHGPTSFARCEPCPMRGDP